MKDVERIEKSEGISEVHVFDTDEPDKRHLAYTIDTNVHEVTFTPEDDFPVDAVALEGFDDIPREFSEKGYIKGGLMYYFAKKLSEQHVTEFIISKTDRSRTRKTKGGRKLVLSYVDFRELKGAITTISNEAKQDRSQYVDGFFHRLFPTRYPKVTGVSKSQARRTIGKLRPDIVEHLTREDVSRVLDFIEILLKTKYRSEFHKRELFRATKIKIDDLAVSEVINQFESMLKDNPAETNWGKFLKRNLFLVDSKYIHALPELNVVLAGSRKADFGLVDAQGYLDIFETKKPSARLLSSRTDRGNYYWSTDAIKAIVQAEKYLFHAERKAASLAEDIGSQRKVNVQVIRPRAFVVMGNSEELSDANMRSDFRILRMSLKNVEVVLYDELLDRIKNQKDKMYVT